MKKVRTIPPPMSEALRGEAPLVKFLYFWLEPQGEVRFSTREIAEATGISQGSALMSLRRLREVGLVEDVGEQRERVRSTYRVMRL